MTQTTSSTTAMTKSGLSRMNHDTLDTLAIESFATPLPEGLTKDEKVEMLLQMQVQAEADEKDAPAEETASADSEPTTATATHVYIRIANQEGVGGDQPVFIQVNGFSALIHREKWVKLRAFFLPALKYARETHFFRSEEGVLQQKEVKRFNVEVRSLEQGIPDEASTLDVL